MSLRFPKVLPSYAYRDPAEFVRFDGASIRIAVPTADESIEPVIDRYDRQFRRLHVEQLKRGKR